MEYKKNDYVTVTIDDIGNDGEGIGKVDGFTLFIKDAIIGDTVEAKIIKSKKHYAYARLEKVLSPSPFRVQPLCAFHRQCGGCQIQAMDYAKQLEFKQNKVKNNLLRIGGFSEKEIEQVMEPVVGMEEPFYYRNKAQYPVGQDKEGNPVAGFYAGRTHTIIANTDCHLGRKENKEILDTILAYMKEFHVVPYDETTGKGLIRHVLIRTGFESGEIMVCLVVNYRKRGEHAVTTGKGGKAGADKNGTVPIKGQSACDDTQSYLPHQKELLDRLSRIPNMTSVSISINTANTNVIMGTEIHTLWGRDTIRDSIRVRNMQTEGMDFTGEKLEFSISPLSFYQVNPRQTEKLYSLALEYAHLTGKETVWDLYCGIGTISLFMATKAKQVYGVEIIPAAIEDAKENARVNGITNATFFVGKAEEVLPAFYEGESSAVFGDIGECAKSAFRQESAGAGRDAGSEEGTFAAERTDAGAVQGGTADMRHPDVIVVDPPRKGCDEKCLDTMLKMAPKRIVYVSCDSATLARDLRVLCDGGYEVKRVRAVDQFANTVHVETVILLSRKTPDAIIEIDLEMSELDLTRAESKATYKEIGEYVQNKYGLHVTNLYIAQVKREFGIIERINYNVGEGKNRVPKVTPEKREAIIDALKYFQMI